mgnify:CR=1 FL=1|jgi:hypothetical protein
MESKRNNFGYVVAWVKYGKDGVISEYEAWHIANLHKAKLLYLFVRLFFRPQRIALRKPEGDLTIKKHQKK